MLQRAQTSRSTSGHRHFSRDLDVYPASPGGKLPNQSFQDRPSGTSWLEDYPTFSSATSMRHDACLFRPFPCWFALFRCYCHSNTQLQGGACRRSPGTPWQGWSVCRPVPVGEKKPDEQGRPGMGKWKTGRWQRAIQNVSQVAIGYRIGGTWNSSPPVTDRASRSLNHECLWLYLEVIRPFVQVRQDSGRNSGQRK